MCGATAPVTSRPLHGVPVTLEDGNDVAGLRTTLGTEVFDRVADVDGTAAGWERLALVSAQRLGRSLSPEAPDP